MEWILIEKFASLGLGALIAIIVLVWKRFDDKAHRKEIYDLSGKMLKSLENNTEVYTCLKKSIDLLVENLLEIKKR